MFVIVLIEIPHWIVSEIISFKQSIRIKYIKAQSCWRAVKGLRRSKCKAIQKNEGTRDIRWVDEITD